MNALTLSFWAAAARRTWFERSSLSDIVVLMVQSITWSHHYINACPIGPTVRDFNSVLEWLAAN